MTFPRSTLPCAAPPAYLPGKYSVFGSAKRLRKTQPPGSIAGLSSFSPVTAGLPLIQRMFEKPCLLKILTWKIRKPKSIASFSGEVSILTEWSLHKDAMWCSTHLKPAGPSTLLATPMPRWDGKALIFTTPRGLFTATYLKKNNCDLPAGFIPAGSFV